MFDESDYRDVELAIEIATDCHKGQKDKSGKPYILHPLAIMTMMEKDGFAAPVLCAALLHDVVEDTWMTLNRLDEWFSDEVVTAVDHLTHRDDETYKQYRERCISNKIAMAVKLYDSRHNIQRSEGVDDPNFLNFIQTRYGGTVQLILGKIWADPHIFDDIMRNPALEIPDPWWGSDDGSQ